jgi:FixJ family two-component response regulator
LFRRSITRLLEHNTYRVEAYESLDRLGDTSRLPSVGCVVLDMNLPGAGGLEIQENLTNLAPTLAIVFLTGFGKIASSVQAMKRGAVDFLEKPVEERALLDAVESAIDRSRQLHLEKRELDQIRTRYQALTKREQDVFTLITSGLLNKQAGAELGITEKTIKVHRAQVMDKMGAESFAELVKISQRLRLSNGEDNTASRNRS